MIKLVVEQLKLLILLVLDLLRRSQKIAEFVWYRKHEVERICESNTDFYDKTMRVESWLNRSNCKEIRSFMDTNFPCPTKKPRDFVSRPIQQILVRYNLANDEGCKEEKLTKLYDLSEEIDTVFHLQSREGSRKLFKIITNSKHVADASVKKLECLVDILYIILTYRLTIIFAEHLAATKYDPNLDSHTETLISLWNNLVLSDKRQGSKTTHLAFPKELSYQISEKSDIVSSRWSHIGFQGEDPGTDFRGMGLLGLIQLEYLARKPKQLPTDLLKRSHDDVYWYPFAIVGISITFNLLSLFKEGAMKHLYYDEGDVLFRDKQGAVKVTKTFNDLYVELFLRFDCFWHESKPQNIFEFKSLMEKFVDIVRVDLSNRNFTMKFIY